MSASSSVPMHCALAMPEQLCGLNETVASYLIHTADISFHLPSELFDLVKMDSDKMF